MFEAAFPVLVGADRTPYEEISKKLIPGFRALENIMQQYGLHVAGDMVRRLYLDVDYIHTHLPSFQRADVIGWLQRMKVELQSYGGRMLSMCESAITEEELFGIKDKLLGRGFELEMIEAVRSEDLKLPLAWSIVASKLVEKSV